MFKNSLVVNLLKHYLIFLSLFFVLRVVFFFVNYEEIPTNLLLKSFLVGFRFDSSVSSYITFLFIIFSLVFGGFKLIKINIKPFLAVIHKTISFFVIFFSFADIEYFHKFGTHLGYKDFEYITSIEVYKTIIADHNPILYGIAIFSIFYLLHLLFKWTKIWSIFEERVSIKSEPLIITLFIGVMIISARSGIDQGTLNWGVAYFSENNLANNGSLNPIFYIVKSYEYYIKEKKRGIKRDITESEIRELRKIFVLPNDSLLESSNPLLRITKGRRERRDYNVVLILLESWMNHYIGVLGNSPGATPYFDKLAEDGVLFKNFYSSGYRSNRGIFSTFSGFPSQGGKPVIKRMEAQKPFLSLPSILKKRGYSTHFAYGGDLEFDNMKGFLRVNGVDNFIGISDFSLSDRFGKWGVPDSILFNRAFEDIKTIKEPFFYSMFTLSNHEPFDLPDQRFKKFGKEYSDYKSLNCILYNDYYLNRFIEELKSIGKFENTIFIFVADHGRRVAKKDKYDKVRFNVPFMIYAPNIIDHKVVLKYGSQSDILPTVMGVLGGDYKHSSLGRDLFNIEDNGFAYSIDGSSESYIDSSSITILNRGGQFKTIVDSLGTFIYSDSVSNNKNKLKLIKEVSSAIVYRSLFTE